MRFKFLASIILSVFLSVHAYSQEICDNGVDDDGDSLIDGLDPDCTGQATWTCNTSGIVMKEDKVYTVDLMTGSVVQIGTTSSLSSQAIGFNSADNLVWGISSNEEVFSLGSDLSVTTYPLTGVTIDNSVPYNVAEVVSKELIIYSSDQTVIYKVDIDSTSPTFLEVSSNSSFGGYNFADMSYNPVDGNIYAIDGDDMNLYSIDPSTLVESLVGSTGIPQAPGGVSFGKSFSDANGNFFTYSTKSGYELKDKMIILKKTHDYDNRYEEISSLSATIGGDGANCYNTVIFTNEICDNGIDDDADGDIDCQDADCDYFEDCLEIEANVSSTDTTCVNGIATFQVFFTNNSSVTATFDVNANLANNFEFAHDTLDFFEETSSFSGATFPSDGDTGALTWSEISLVAGGTLRLSFDAIVDENTPFSNYSTSFSISGSTLLDPNLTTTVTIEDCSLEDTYECDPAFYQVYKKSGRNQPNVYGVLNPITGDYTQIAIASDKANGLGFDTNTGLVYGASGKKFIQLEEDGKVTYLGLDFAQSCYRGDMDGNGFWWGAVGNDMLKVDPSVPEIVATYSGQGTPGWDFALNEDGNFYALHGRNLYKFDTSTNLKSHLGQVIGNDIPTTGYGAQWTGSDGKLYASNNQQGKIVRVDVNTLEARVVSTSIAGLSLNDGFSCPLSIPAVYEFDYGDNSRLPVARVLNYFQDLDGNDIPDYTSVWLGETTTYDELDPKNSAANGDLDDGFELSAEISNGQITATLDLSSSYSMTCYYGMGIDWDDDGVFDYETFGSYVVNETFQQTFNLDVPNGKLFGNVNARLIVNEKEVNSSNMSGDILDMGEVEDLRVFIYTAEDCSNGIDDDGDGLVDCDDPDCVNAEITSMYINQTERINLIDGGVVCLTEMESNPVLMHAGVSGNAQSVVFTLSGAINETITVNDSPYRINLYPVAGNVTINAAAFEEDNGGGLGLCTASEITVSFEECIEICGNGLDDDYDGLTDCDDPDCGFSANAGNDKDIDFGTAGMLYGSASGGEEAYTYSWTPATDIDDPTSATPLVDPSSDTTYTLTVTDANGCTATDEVTVYVDGPTEDPILYGCAWDADGVPTCLENDPLSCSLDFLNDVNLTFKEGQDLTAVIPNAVQYDGEGDIIVSTDNTEVFVTFIHEGTPYENSLVYFTYNTASPLMDTDEILDMTAVFPNMSVNSGGSGDLNFGDKVSIGTFNSGTSIGFALVTRGWQENTQTVSDSYVTFYSNHNFNPESTTAKKVHSQSLIDSQNNAVLYGFEEINRDYLSCDHDFNDVLFLVSSADSSSDFDMSELYTLEVNNSANPCVPCGLETTDIGLYKGTANWGALSGATSYKVRFRRWGTNDSWSYRSTSNTSFNLGSVKNLDPGTHYEWQVSADFNGERGCNSLSNVFTTYPECQMPIGNAATNVTSVSATISWGGVLSASRYTVRFKPNGAPDSEYQWRNAGANTSLNLTGLTPNTVYDWNVSAICGDNYSCYGPFASANNFTTLTEGRAMADEVTENCSTTISNLEYQSNGSFATDFIQKREIIHADVDGDGLEDIVISSEDEVNKLTVYLNSENPSQRFVNPYALAVPEVPDFIAFDDVDFDDKLDLLISNEATENVFVLKNNGAPGLVSFEVIDRIPTDIKPVGLGAVDISGGDYKNVISVSSGNDQLYLFENSFEGNAEMLASEQRHIFASSKNLTTGKSPSQMLTEDLNRDGMMDFLLINSVENTLTVFYHGNYQDSISTVSNASSTSYLSMHLPTGLNPSDVTVGDLNGDEMPEILVLNKGDLSVDVYENLSSAETGFMFIHKSTLSLEMMPEKVFCAEMNSDYKAELVISFEEGTSLGIYEMTDMSAWGYSESEMIDLGAEVESVSIGNFTEDEIADIAYITKGASEWKLLENISPEVNPWIQVQVERSLLEENAVEFRASSNLLGEYEWQLKQGNEYLTLEDDKFFRGTNSSLLVLSAPEDFDGEHLRVKLKDDECASKYLKKNVSIDISKLGNQKMSISPNPTSGEFQVSISDLNPRSRLEILNPQGKVVLNKDLRGLEEKVELQFNLSRESRGTYLVRLNEQGKVTVKRLILK